MLNCEQENFNICILASWTCAARDVAPLTTAGLGRINQSIEAFVYCVLGSQANTRSSIFSSAGVFKETQTEFHDNDSHLIMQAISRAEGRISCIPNNTEKCISFSIGQLRFIDSVQFLLTSLDRLVAASQPKAFQITARYELNREKRDLLLRKGVYSYEYMDAWKRFAEPRLPPKEAFYSKLTDEGISEKDYTHAQKVWETFGCRDLGDYHNLYNRTDVLLLADVFETLRKTCMWQYGLDPAHCYSSPGLSWDAVLKKTGVELELLTDYDQHLFIEKGLRGGISMVSKRCARGQQPTGSALRPIQAKIPHPIPER